MNVYPHNNAKEINNFLPELKKSEQSWTIYSRIWYRHHIWHCDPYCYASHHQPSQELLPLPLTSASCFLDISSIVIEDRSLGITFLSGIGRMNARIHIPIPCAGRYG